MFWLFCDDFNRVPPTSHATGHREYQAKRAQLARLQKTRALEALQVPIPVLAPPLRATHTLIPQTSSYFGIQGVFGHLGLSSYEFFFVVLALAAQTLPLPGSLF